jgi:hypothetical protein
MTGSSHVALGKAVCAAVDGKRCFFLFSMRGGQKMQVSDPKVLRIALLTLAAAWSVSSGALMRADCSPKGNCTDNCETNNSWAIMDKFDNFLFYEFFTPVAPKGATDPCTGYKNCNACHSSSGSGGNPGTPLKVNWSLWKVGTINCPHDIWTGVYSQSTYDDSNIGYYVKGGISTFNTDCLVSGG